MKNQLAINVLEVIRLSFSIIVCCVFLFNQACSSQRPYADDTLSGEERNCQHWLNDIEDTFEQYDLSDPETARIDSFPQLRVNRFLAAMGKQTAANGNFADWLEEMRQLDTKVKQLELANLPDSAMQELILKQPMQGTLEGSLQQCGKRLNKLSLNNAEHQETLFGQAVVPDAYQSWKRIVGLYPLASFAASFSIERLHRELNADFNIPLEKLPQQGKLIRYTPPPGKPLSAELISAMLKPAYRNPLGIPQLTPIQLHQLLQQYAPIWEIDTRNDSDKIGTVSLDATEQPQVDIKQPAVYFTHRYARWQGQVVLQLIYQVWLPAREKTGLLDLYGGPLDSVIWRVTLNPEGTPIAFDSIHACGCYYLLFPGQGYRAVAPKDGAEPVLSPKTIAGIPPGKRLLLRLQGRSHYLQQIALLAETNEPATPNYVFHEMEQLRSLPMPNGSKHSLYGEDGIIEASERAERFLLWPFGVASPGAMRQWGAHAIAFIGRRHFDDPWLLENLLEEK